MSAPRALNAFVCCEPGHALFVWEGGFELDRSGTTDDRTTGIARMDRAVRIGHVRFADDALTRVEGETVIARFVEGGGDAANADAAGSLRLESLAADGAVYISSGDRELLADSVRYDPATGLARATSNPGNRVLIYRGPGSGSDAPLSAEAMTWNLITDRVEVVQPGASSSSGP